MFKQIFAVVALIIPMSTFALDATSAMPEDGVKLVKQVTDELGIKTPSSDLKRKIYDSIQYALKDNWNSYWVGNGDLEASKFKDDKVRVFEYLIANDNRFCVTTFTYFPDARQIFIAQKEFVAGASDLVLKAFQEKKANQKFKVIKETDNYGFLKENGKVAFEVYHVKNDAGAVSYSRYAVIDVN